MITFGVYEITAMILSIIIALFFAVLRYSVSSLTPGRLRGGEANKRAEKIADLMEAPISLGFSLRFLHNAGIFLCGSVIAYGIFHSAGRIVPFYPPVWLFIAVALVVAILDIFMAHFLPFNGYDFVIKNSSLYNFVYNFSHPFLAVLTFFVKPFIPKESSAKVRLTENELLMMVEEASKQGVLEEEEKEMITSVFELSSTTAHEIMIPRMDIMAVELKSPLTKVVDLALDHGYSRIPVYENSIDKIVGIIHTKDLITALRERKMDTPLRKFMRKPLFIPNNKKIDEILRDMQASKMAMAIIIDEYGGTDGLVTMEDVIEEIVGEIADEYDDEPEPVVKNEDGSFTADGKTAIEVVNDFIEGNISDEEFETVGGYIYGLAGHIPSEGEEIEDQDLSFTVEKITGNRITAVRIRKIVPAQEARPEESLQEELQA